MVSFWSNIPISKKERSFHTRDFIHVAYLAQKIQSCSLELNNLASIKMQSCFWYFDNFVYEYSAIVVSVIILHRDIDVDRERAAQLITSGTYPCTLRYSFNNGKPNRDLSGASGIPRKIVRGRKHWDDTTHNERADGGVVSIMAHAKVIRTISITWA